MLWSMCDDINAASDVPGGNEADFAPAVKGGNGYAVCERTLQILRGGEKQI